MSRHIGTVAAIIGLTLVACIRTDSPLAAAASNSPIPGSNGVSYRIFDRPVDATLMMTSVQATEGIIPGIVCYVHHTSPPGPWIHIDTNSSLTSACELVQNDSSFEGRAVVPASYVNNGYTTRIILFGVPASAGAWDY